MVANQNFVWEQGDDLEIKLIYKEGATVEAAIPIDLSTGFALRMDITSATPGKERLYTFNTESIADVDAIQSGSQPDTVIEGVLSSGAGGTPNIHITVPRAITLPGGSVYAKMIATSPEGVFNYDIFLRNTVSNKQAKILFGQITIVESQTLWL